MDSMLSAKENAKAAWKEVDRLRAELAEATKLLSEARFGLFAFVPVSCGETITRIDAFLSRQEKPNE